MKRARSPPRSPPRNLADLLSESLRIPVGTLKGETTPSSPSVHHRGIHNETAAAAAGAGEVAAAAATTISRDVVRPPASPCLKMDRGRRRRHPLSNLQDGIVGGTDAALAKGETIRKGFQSPSGKKRLPRRGTAAVAAYRSEVSGSIVGAPAAAGATAPSILDPQPLTGALGGAVRVMTTTPIKGKSRSRSSRVGESVRGESAGAANNGSSGSCSSHSNDLSAAPLRSGRGGDAERPQTNAVIAVVHGTRRRSGGEHLIAAAGAVDNRRRATIARGDPTASDVASSLPSAPLLEAVGLTPEQAVVTAPAVAAGGKPVVHAARRISICRRSSGRGSSSGSGSISDSRGETLVSSHANNASNEAGLDANSASMTLGIPGSLQLISGGAARRVNTRSSSGSTSSNGSTGPMASSANGNSSSSNTSGAASASTSVRAARRVSTRSGSSGSIERSSAGARGVGGNGKCERLLRRTSFAVGEWAGVCDGCREKQEAGGERVEDGKALCEDCAAEADDVEGLRKMKRPRVSDTKPSVRRRSAIQPPTNTGWTKSAGADLGEEELDPSRNLTIDDFEVQASLGMGKFGKVYRATPKLKLPGKTRRFALKMLGKASLKDCSHQERINLRREIEIQSSLSHANIVRMISWFEDPKWFYLLLDFAAGGDVYKALRQCENGGLPEATAAKYLLGAARAVAYLHEHHIIHRDIKPENLLLDGRGQVKLSDFGWAVQATPPYHHQRRTMCGTPEYAAPEMLVASPKYTYQVDMWSLGVLGYELLAGKTPFVNARKNTVDYSHADDEFDHEKAVEIEAVHEGDPHAGLYGRIVGWKGCREGLFGEGTRGENFPDNAQDVVLAMLRPEAYDRLESRDVLNMAWLALPGYESVDSSSVNPK